MSNLDTQKTSLIDELINYLKRPRHDIKLSEKKFSSKLKEVMMYWSLGIFVAYVSVLFSAFFLERSGIDDSQNMLQNFFTDYSIFFVMFVVFLWGPVTEELTFRLGLKFSPYRLGYSLAFILFLLLEAFASVHDSFASLLELYIKNINGFYVLVIIIFYYLIIGFLFSLLLKGKLLNTFFVQLYSRYFAYIFYSSAILFASVHLFNFANFKEIWLALPFLVAPQLFLGLIIAYVRMHYSMWWAIFYHVIHNTLVSAPILFLSRVSPQTLSLIEAEDSEGLLSIALNEKIMIVFGIGMGIAILVMFFVLFANLVQEHHNYRKSRKGKS